MMRDMGRKAQRYKPGDAPAPDRLIPYVIESTVDFGNNSEVDVSYLGLGLTTLRLGFGGGLGRPTAG